MRIRFATPLHVLALALLGSLVSTGQTQTPFAKLVLRAESHKTILQPGVLAQAAAAQPRLHIEILKGDGGVNTLGSDTVVQPVVQVRDRNDQPVADVAVTFTAPNDGPSATFLNGSRSVTLMTDSSGEAILLGMKPVNPGQFQISVSASVGSETVVTAISLTNELREQPAATTTTGAKKHGLSKGAILAIVGAGAAAAIGIGVGMGGHSGSSSSTNNSSGSSASIGLGSGGVTAGPPR